MKVGIKDKYFKWVCDLIFDDEHFIENSYLKLLRHLNSVQFVPVLLMDENRYDDGIYLRQRFAFDTDIDYEKIDRYFSEPCSILEMMVALSLRCEEDIMSDYDYGNRINVWFWGMIDSLGFDNQYDENYNPDIVDSGVYILNNRLYNRNGSGGLFITNDINCDMRNLEIWYQMNKFLTEMEGDNYGERYYRSSNGL